MPAESRRDVRYQSSQKAVLVAESGVGNLCVITDLSSGGLCLALVGAPGPWKKEHIDLEVNQRTFPCIIVGGGKKKLHCQFERPINESDFRAILPYAGTGIGSDIADKEVVLKLRHEAPALSYFQARNDDNIVPEPAASSQRAPSARVPAPSDLSVVYIEGSLAGRDQIDPAIDALDATVDAINPYQTPDERKRWEEGFKDAVRLVAKRLAR